MSDESTQICNGALDLLGVGTETARRLASYALDQTDTGQWFQDNLSAAIDHELLMEEYVESLCYWPATSAGGDVDRIDHAPFLYAYAVPTVVAEIAVLRFRGLVSSGDYSSILDGRPVGDYVHCDYSTADFAWRLLMAIRTGLSPGLRRCVEYRLAVWGAGHFLVGPRGDEKRRLLQAEYESLILPNAKRQNREVTGREVIREAPVAIGEVTWQSPPS